MTARLSEQWLFQQDLHILFCHYLLEIFYEEARLKALLNTDVLATAGEDLIDLPLDELVAEWQALPGSTAPFVVPSWEQDWILACSWPPRFSTAIWDWCRTLQWESPRVTGRPADGAAELLTRFVVNTGILPPKTLDKAKRMEPRDFPECPRTVRQLTYTLMEATRQLSRLSGVALWPKRRRKVYSLRRIHQYQPYYGVSARPHWPEAKLTYTVLRQVLAKQSVGPLEDFSRRHCRPLDAAGRDLVARHCAFSSAWREQHAQWLRPLLNSFC